MYHGPTTASLGLVSKQSEVYTGYTYKGVHQGYIQEGSRRKSKRPRMGAGQLLAALTKEYYVATKVTL